MAIKSDRVGELLSGIKRNSRALVSPEGVPLDIQAASHGERITALALDLLFMFIAVILLYAMVVMLFLSGSSYGVLATLVLFLAFIVRNLYFIHFELAWQGRTPGKKICGLRVINRNGGELLPSAIVARNLTREVEIFLPISLFFSMGGENSSWQGLATFGWVIAISMVPLFNKAHLRAGDLIGGTQVISMPKRVLLQDLSFDAAITRLPGTAPSAQSAGGPQPGTAAQPQLGQGYIFTPDQLAIYGTFELQVLEEFLRRPHTKASEQLLTEVCQKICRKINWPEEIPPHRVRAFLTDFYTAERAELERGQLFGKIKEDKNTARH